MTPWALENIATYQQYGSVEAALAAGKTFHIWAKPMLDSFIFLGGSGATLGLILAIFIASRRADYRQVAKLALPSGIFQINEPILGNDSNLLIVFYVQIMPDDFVMQLHRF